MSVWWFWGYIASLPFIAWAGMEVAAWWDSADNWLTRRLDANAHRADRRRCDELDRKRRGAGE